MKWSENDLYMPGEDIESRVTVDKGVGTTVSLWLRPLVIDTIKLSASASCTSGAADAFERDLLVKVCVLMTIKILNKRNVSVLLFTPSSGYNICNCIPHMTCPWWT